QQFRNTDGHTRCRISGYNPPKAKSIQRSNGSPCNRFKEVALFAFGHAHFKPNAFMQIIQDEFGKKIQSTYCKSGQAISGYKPSKQHGVGCTDKSPGKSFGNMSSS